MAKKPEVPPIRLISILVGIMIGCIFSYIYHANLPTFPFVSYPGVEYLGDMYSRAYEMNVASLVVFVAIPLLAGFICGLLHPAMAMRNGLYVGFFTGLFNSILATIKLIFAPPYLILGEVYAFGFFAIMSVFIWTLLAAAGALLAQRFYD